MAVKLVQATEKNLVLHTYSRTLWSASKAEKNEKIVLVFKKKLERSFMIF